MHRYNESVLQNWRNNAERELYLNSNSQYDLNDSRLFDFNGEELNNTVEDSWIDLDKFKEAGRQAPHDSDDEFDGEQEDDGEDDDDDSKTLRLNSEESGNERDDVKDPFKSYRYKKKINFDVDGAMGTDVKSKRSFNDGYDLNTSLTTILSKERQHTNSENKILFMDVSNSSSMLSNVSGSDVSFKSSAKKRKIKASSSSQSNSIDYANRIVFIGIIASLSFSAGYALGQSRKH